MAIYLVDYENVYIEGLKGLEELGEEDTLHIFYTQNRCGLTFHLYEQLTRCKAQVQLNEVSVSLKNSDPVKNALDIQLMMFTGYLIGSRQTEHVYIVSKDKDFRLGTEFFERFISDSTTHLSIVSSIAEVFCPEAEQPVTEEENPSLTKEMLDSLIGELTAAGYPDAVQHQPDESPAGFAAFCEKYAAIQKPEPEKQEPDFTVQYINSVRSLLGKSTDEETVSRICEIISSADTLVELNNGLARYYRDGERAKEVYHKCKPQFESLRHLSRARNKG